MPAVSGSASYNKKSGTLTVSADGKRTTWTAKGDQNPSKTFDIEAIANLRQTPADSPKVSLQIIEVLPGDTKQQKHVFQFSSDDNGRSQANAIKTALSVAILAKTSLNSVTAAQAVPPESNGSGAPAAMAIAAVVSAGTTSKSSSQFDDDRLLADQSLQQTFLSTNKQLGATFAESMKARPSSISATAFHRQFWTSRIKLLRAFAVQQSQRKGDYNVLSVVKPRMEGEELHLSVTAEQVTLILSQYPVVRKAKAQLADRLEENVFWTRFFQSRLFKKLKGEKITEADKRDDLLDKYLTASDDDLEREKKLLAAHIPHTIDLAGNEQDNSQRQGNAPDRDNRPSAPDRVPIMRALNALSERLVSQVAPNDVDPSAPIGVDEATFKEMELRDLAAETESQRLILHIRDKAKFFATGKGTDESQSQLLFSKQNPDDVLSVLNADLNSTKSLGLADTIGVEDSDSDDEMEGDGQSRTTRVGSKKSRRQATQQVFSSVKDRRDRSNDQLASTDEDAIASELGLSVTTYRNATLSQAATVVFLNHFWSVYHSGDSNRAGELEGVTEALQKSLQAIRAAGEASEMERKKKIDETKELYRAHQQRTGRQQRFDPESIKGGRTVIDQLMASTVRSIQFALETWQKAYNLAVAEQVVG